ncbi:MAG: protein kinase, partial [Myxococcota bacterium]
SNIMLDDTRRPPEVRILDFGIAKLVSGSARNPTTHGRVMGTGFYMAPEQARGEKIDARADLFAFGVLLFEMITLRRTWVRNDRGGPIRAFAEPARRNEFNTPTAILNRIAHETRPLVSDFRPGLPPALDKVITWALAIEPSARPSDASALFRALQEATQGMATVLTEPNPVAGMPTQPDGPASSLGPVDPTWSRSRAVITEFSGMERSGPTLALPTDNEPNETLALPAQNEVQVTQVSTDASIPSVAAVESGIGARDPTIALPPAASGIDAGEWADDGTLVQEDVVTTEPTRAMPEPALDRTPVIMARRPTGPSGAYRGARSSVFLADASPALKTTVVIMAMLTGAALLLLAGYQMGRQTVVIQAIPVDPKVEEARGEFPLIAPGRPEAVPSAALNEPMPARARPSSSPPKEAQPPSEARAPRQPSRRRRTPPAPDPLDDLHRLMNEIRADAQDLEAVRKLGAEIEARARAVSDRTERARIQRIAQSSALLGDIEGIEQALDALTSALKSR